MCVRTWHWTGGDWDVNAKLWVQKKLIADDNYDKNKEPVKKEGQCYRIINYYQKAQRLIKTIQWFIEK